MDFPMGGLFGSFFVFWILWFALLALVNIVFCAGVARDGGEFAADHGDTILVGPMFWALATLMGGVFVAAIYWVIHRSVLANYGKPLSVVKDSDIFPRT